MTRIQRKLHKELKALYVKTDLSGGLTDEQKGTVDALRAEYKLIFNELHEEYIQKEIDCLNNKEISLITKGRE